MVALTQLVDEQVLQHCVDEASAAEGASEAEAIVVVLDDADDFVADIAARDERWRVGVEGRARALLGIGKVGGEEAENGLLLLLVVVVVMLKLRRAEAGHLRCKWVERANIVREGARTRYRHKAVRELANGSLNLVAMMGLIKRRMHFSEKHRASVRSKKPGLDSRGVLDGYDGRHRRRGWASAQRLGMMNHRHTRERRKG